MVNEVMKCLLVIVMSGVFAVLPSVSVNGRQSSDDISRREKVYLQKEVDQKAVIISKPEAQWTEKARRENVKGFVLLRGILAASGKVEDVEVLEGLPYGLTEEAIKVAKKIKFSPAMKDGKRVSMYQKLSYNFNGA